MIDVRRLDREHLERAYGLDSQRLLPWPALNAPFEGAWCVLRPGDESTRHSHHEHEIFIAIAGSAELIVDDERHPFSAGDIVRLPPGSDHGVVNDGDVAFEYYALWWDDRMSARFMIRHAAGTP